MIRLEGVRKRFGAREVVRGVDLEVRQGELLVLLGESGCGKTTTLKMINRLLEPSAGRIEVFGRDVSSEDPVALRRRIGWVIQGVGLFPHWTVARNVATVPDLLGWSAKETASRVDALLEQVGLAPAEFRSRLPSTLSGGQRQRVGVARALAAAPSLMLMDEPFGAVDPITRDGLQTEYRALHERLGLTTVMVTHDLTEALLLADRIGVMHEGTLVALDSPERLFTAHPHPQVRRLAEMRERQMRVRGR